MSFKYATLPTDPCVVCRKLDGTETDWPEVASSTHSVAFVPSRQPVNGTTLVVPRRHLFDPADLTEEETDDFFLLVRSMINATMSMIKPKYYQISQYIGVTGNEPIDHLHWRLEPRYEVPENAGIPIGDLPVTPFAELIRISELLRQASVWQRGLPAAS